MLTDGAADERFMCEAIVEAQRARDRDEVPVGAVVVLDGVIVGRGFNQPIGTHDPTAHAEIVALREAAGTVGNYRLPGADLFVTVEPCLMCAGALVHARIRRLVYGAPEPRTGAAWSAIPVLDDPALNHRVEVVGSVMEEQCRQLMQAFFASRRT